MEEFSGDPGRLCGLRPNPIKRGSLWRKKAHIWNKHGTGRGAVLNMDKRAASEISGRQHVVGKEENAATLFAPLAHVESDTRPTVLLIGEEGKTATIASWAECAGLRCVGQIAPEDVPERLARTVSLDLILFDGRGLDMAARLGLAGAQALAGHHGIASARLVVMTDLAGLGCALAILGGPETDFLCEPTQTDIITALVTAGQRQTTVSALHDTTTDGDMARIERLSDEVRRLATTIERMALGAPSLSLSGDIVLDKRGGYRGEGDEIRPKPADRSQPRIHMSADAPAGDELTHTEIRQFIRARRMRDQYLPADLFADPAWDMMLDLLAAKLAGQHVSVSSLCIAAAVPPTTALRWIRQLTDRAVFARIDDPADGRRVFIELTDHAAQAVLSWVQAVRHNGGLLAGSR